MIEFIKEHANDDLDRLLLSAGRYPEMNIPFIVDQIKSRRQIKDKLPTWYQEERLIFPTKIAAEQCSSEQTAKFKQNLVEASQHVCDLTGGLGIDSYFISQKVKKHTYIERFPEYCTVAKHNFKVLGATNIDVLNGDSIDLLKQVKDVDVFYIDPARRGEGNKRVYAVQDCEPDLTKLLSSLFSHAPKVIAKLSPMADLHLTLEVFPQATAVYVLSVRNECKELLFVLENKEHIDSPQIHCINFTASNEIETFVFTLNEERSVSDSVTGEVLSYLYEPNAAVLKAGAFKAIASRFGLNKLHVSSHLYTSSQQIQEFPGRSFIVEELIPFNNKACKALVKQIPQANITIRNFPISVQELRKRTKILDGGDVYIFATTLKNGEKVLLKCRKM